MNTVAQKCKKCNKPTLDPTGLCHLHRVSGSVTTTGGRTVPTIKSGSPVEEKTAGWLVNETGIDISSYSVKNALSELEENEQFAQWMRARVTVRAIESVYTQKGAESASSYAKKADDTSLALIWERMNGSNMSEFFDDGMRDSFINIVRQEVEDRVDSGNFAPLDISGYVQSLHAGAEPHGSATFF